jgi:Cu+-exporting ATPase
MSQTLAETTITCSHCGEPCESPITVNDQLFFCCEGCKTVYQILNKNGLCNYYNFNEHPGINRKRTVRRDKFDFLDQKEIRGKLISFEDAGQCVIELYIPQIHCSSCLYLLENLSKLEPAILESRVNFSRKQLRVRLDHRKLSLKNLAGLLADLGYEPYISLQDLKGARPGVRRRLIYQLGIAGFCFGNIMLLSFPEYLGLEAADAALLNMFRILSLVLSLPVFFYCAYPFFSAGWKGLKHGVLNIDAPIALAILVTFARSVYEVVTGTGSGYFDSMSGIVFFMLLGRVVQDRSYKKLSFERDFESYFPVAVTRVGEQGNTPITLPQIKPGDTLLINNNELIPADGILTRGTALIDYSFVTGESVPVTREMGSILYAGGKQLAGNIELLVIKEVNQSYLTSLWSRDDMQSESGKMKTSFVQSLSRYFTLLVFMIAGIAAMYWAINDPSRILNSVTAVLIVACPCALLLANTFTNGNVLSILTRNGLYLKSAQVIENIATTDHLVFDKTGTLTVTDHQDLYYTGISLSPQQRNDLALLCAQSTHPYSRVIAAWLQQTGAGDISEFEEFPGKGLCATVNGTRYLLGSFKFVTGNSSRQDAAAGYGNVHLAINGTHQGWFVISNHYRSSVPSLIQNLSKRYQLSVVSGDNASEKTRLQNQFGDKMKVFFNQSPADKLNYVLSLQQKGERVVMIGDGLNDAGALKKSDTGIALTDNVNNFTPASDGILEADKLSLLQSFIDLCRANRWIVSFSFALSVVYNIAGLWFAVQGTLHPLVAAILMPASTLTIVTISFGFTALWAKHLHLSLGAKNNHKGR